jgi:hypothetical protein
MKTGHALGLMTIVTCGLFVGLLGCSGGGDASPSAIQKIESSRVAGLPVGPGERLFQWLNDLPQTVHLGRGGKRYELQPPREFGLYTGDRLENVADRQALVRAIKEGHDFNLFPGSVIELEANAVTLFKGRNRLQFKKIDGQYRVRLPYAVLGIRGTTLDITVRDDKSAEINLLEGTITIEQSGGEPVTMNGGRQVSIDAQGKLGPMIELPELNPETTHPTD